MAVQKLPADFVAKLKSITAKRAKTVIDHILKHGKITTDDLQMIYGYDHLPRAIRDVREYGVPIVTIRRKKPDGKSMAEYVFGDPSKTQGGKSGRKAFPKQFKAEMAANLGARCGICHAEFELRYLQIDHRVPYEVAGDSNELRVADHMLICGSCNRTKSWSCEHCTNWVDAKDPKVCKSCYWASPLHYRHIARRDIRRVDIVWSETEVAYFDALKKSADRAGIELPEFIKAALKTRPATRS